MLPLPTEKGKLLVQILGGRSVSSREFIVLCTILAHDSFYQMKNTAH